MAMFNDRFHVKSGLPDCETPEKWLVFRIEVVLSAGTILNQGVQWLAYSGVRFALKITSFF